MNVDDILGGGAKTPPNAQFPSIGTKVTLLLTEDGKAVPVREFIKGKPGEQMFFQAKKAVRQSDLDVNLPFDPIPQILLVGKTKDGAELSIWADSEKLKALKAAVREAGVMPKAGGMVAMEYYADDPDSTGPFPRKLYRAQIKAPKESSQ